MSGRRATRRNAQNTAHFDDPPEDCLGGTTSGAVCGNGVCEAGDVAPDGRLLGTTRHYTTPPPPKVLLPIVNWFDELRAKLPVKE